jgi:hypothetical protein
MSARERSDSRKPDQLARAERFRVPHCAICACTDDHACPGGCSWVKATPFGPVTDDCRICSNCLPIVEALAHVAHNPGKALKEHLASAALKRRLRQIREGEWNPQMTGRH